MRRILIVTGVLGGGTGLTFAAAALAASMFPNGTMVATWNQSFPERWAVDTGVEIAPMPMPVDRVVIVDDAAVPDAGGAGDAPGAGN